MIIGILVKESEREICKEVMAIIGKYYLYMPTGCGEVVKSESEVKDRIARYRTCLDRDTAIHTKVANWVTKNTVGKKCLVSSIQRQSSFPCRMRRSYDYWSSANYWKWYRHP